MSKRIGFKPLVLVLALLAATVITGCAGDSSADVDRGRQLFAANCANCHRLDQAGSAGKLGPDLDSAFAAARAAGLDDETIYGIVRRQIDVPRQTDPTNVYTYMPAGLVEGQDAKDVARFVASVAGIPDIAPPSVPGPPGAQIFADNGCAGCHVLGVASATGTTGPNLDQVIPDLTAAFIHESLVEPNAEIADGFAPGVMPSYASLSEEDLKQLVAYLMDCAGDNPDASCTETAAK